MTTTATYGPRATKRDRRTKADMDAIRDALYDLLSAEHPLTVRHCFYRMSSAGLIEKTEGEYKRTIIRVLSEMRREGRIPFSWLTDNTRYMRRPTSFSSAEAALFAVARAYRHHLWDNQDAYVEVWIEKDAVAGLLFEETSAWDVPLMVTRGYCSLSFLASAADTIADQGKPAFIYYLGDYDPSGVHIPQRVEEDLRRFAPGAEIHFTRLSVTPEQITAWNLPTRPTKKIDPRAGGFEGESVEVDAIAPDLLRRLVHEAIVQHVDAEQWRIMKTVEQIERSSLLAMARQMRGGGA